MTTLPDRLELIAEKVAEKMDELIDTKQELDDQEHITFQKEAELATMRAQLKGMLEKFATLDPNSRST